MNCKNAKSFKKWTNANHKKCKTYNKMKSNRKKKGVLKKYKNMSKEELLISILKSEQSIAELCKSKFNSIETREIKKHFFKCIKN